MGRLDGRNILVTGAGRGVGRATALRLAEEGAVVVLIARRQEDLRAVAQEIAARGGRSLELAADVADESAIAGVVGQAQSRLGGVDGLINCAGIGLYGPVETYSLADWRATIDTNLTGVFICCRAVIPSLRERGGGHIISIASGAARQGYPNLAAYSASKFGLIGFMQALAGELDGLGVHVSTILPGSIMTGFGPSAVEEKRRSGRKYLEPEDVAEAVLFLLLQPRRAWTQEMNLWPF